MLEQYVVVDLEMTGLSAKTDRILEIGAVKVVDHQVTDTYQRLVNPKMEIPKEIEALTGINNDMVKLYGIEEQEAVEGFFDFCGTCPLVGHNLIFDYSFLKQFAVNHKINFEKEGIDTLKLARRFLPDTEKKTLDHLCGYLNIQRQQNHRALEDARAEGILLEYLLAHFGEKEPVSFRPIPLVYRAKKQSPATERQKRYLKELLDYHKIEIDVEIDSLTRSEASRKTDRILAQYGRVSNI